MVIKLFAYVKSQPNETLEDHLGKMIKVAHGFAEMLNQNAFDNIKYFEVDVNSDIEGPSKEKRLGFPYPLLKMAEEARTK